MSEEQDRERGSRGGRGRRDPLRSERSEHGRGERREPGRSERRESGRTGRKDDRQGQPRGRGDRQDRGQRSGERREDDRRNGGQRDSDRRGNRRSDESQRRRESQPRSEGRPRRDERPGEREPREGDRPRRDGDRPRRDGNRAGRGRGEKPSYGRDEKRGYGRGGTRGTGRSDRGGKSREFTEAERLQHELRPVRAEHQDPVIPDDVEAKDLYPSARNQLKTLEKETGELVARHLAMAVALLEEQPELAHQHAISASRRAGRIPVAREMLAITAYRTGDYALALRELRTHRRLSGSQGNIALMVEAERAPGRPQKSIETGIEVDPRKLNPAERAQLAIAMSGARLDLGQQQQALIELEISELDPKRAYSYSPELFAAYAAVLEELGRESEARSWRVRAEAAQQAIDEEAGASDQIDVVEIIEYATERDAGTTTEETSTGTATGAEEGTA